MPVAGIPTEYFATEALARALGRYRGRRTPIQPPPRDVTAETQLKMKLVEGIAGLNKQITDYRVGVMDSLTEREKMAMKGVTDSWQALADMNMATAEGQQAKAMALNAVMGEMSKIAARHAFQEPDETIVTTAGATIDSAHKTLANMIQRPDGQEALANALKTRPLLTKEKDGTVMVNPEVQEWVNQNFGIDAVAVISTSANRLPPGDRVSTVRAIADMARGAAVQALRSAPPAGVDLGEWELATQMLASDVAVRGMQAYGPETQMAIDQQAMGQATIQDLYSNVNSLGVGGVDAAAILAHADDMFTRARQTPAEYAETIAKIAPPEDIQTALRQLWTEYRAIGADDPNDPYDPLSRAVADMRARVPGFDTWMTAMRFRGPRAAEKAALYASSHPTELRSWVEAQRNDPDVAASPERARAWITEQAKTAGFGFYRTPAGRALQMSRMGRREDLSEPPRNLPDDAAALPEAASLPRAKVPTAGAPEVLAGRGGYTFSENSDGSYTIVGAPKARPNGSPPPPVGTTVNVGAPGWANIRAELAELHGARAASPSGMIAAAETPSVRPFEVGAYHGRAGTAEMAEELEAGGQAATTTEEEKLQKVFEEIMSGSEPTAPEITPTAPMVNPQAVPTTTPPALPEEPQSRAILRDRNAALAAFARRPPAPRA